MYWAAGAQDKLEDVVQRHFTKRFQFVPPGSGWQLPNPETLFKEAAWQLPQLQQLKVELNGVKSKLNDLPLKEWHAHTRSMNKAGDVLWHLRAAVDPEFITQAWCKLYENVASNYLVPPAVFVSGSLNTLHLCEAPGAFITSLNHYLRVLCPTIKTLERWRFGTDFTGDLMNRSNLDQLVAEAVQMGDVLLVTADGSIDCQDDPGEQECHVSSLHFCEAVAALMVLAPGGSLLLKMFTFYEGQTACLVYLLCCVFRSVVVFKPATSREGNSEVYLCCREYAGSSSVQPWLSVLRLHYGPEPKTEAFFPKEAIPKTFLRQLCSCAKLFKEIQVSVIENNIQSFMFRHLVDWSRVKTLRRMVVDEFFWRYQVQPIDDNLKILNKSKMCAIPELLKEPKEEGFSYSERHGRAALLPAQLLGVLQQQLRQMQVAWPYQQDVEWLALSGEVDGVSLTRGKAVERVSSSKFCRGCVLRVFAEACRATGTLERTRSLPSAQGVRPSLPEELDWQSVRVVDCGDAPRRSVAAGQEEAKRACFLAIVAALRDLGEGEHLLLLGYPLLTQFNVAVAYLLCHAFQQVGFIRPRGRDCALLFRCLQRNVQQCKSVLEQVELELGRMDLHESVLSLLPINKLCGINSYEDKVSSELEEASAENCSLTVEGEFYLCVINMNHMSIAEHVEDIVQHVVAQQ
ncbi:cap-specific mRNA (nucleoside-2'-O-)-methyltransferase 2 isoform X2 [Bacillus rossius redtenbacheri]|uniref:cap-specific mRNA (nucleoside-2'-O-)-methyltransferase 2 isoform X2 n=1 Tax=Bacillus rossius redtenbacheri TaxID=93214 RepID=UPI002FDD4C05